MLCISTSERVLRIPFTGQNHFIVPKKKFFCLFSVTNGKKEEESAKKYEVSVSKNDFHQQTACVAPVCWSKYTTEVLAPKIGIILVQMPLWLIASANTGNCKKNYKFFLRWQPLLPILLQSPNHLSTTSRA